MSGIPRCPSCGRPLAASLVRCPYCMEAIPGAMRRRAIFAIGAALSISTLAFAASRLSPSLADAIAAPLRSPKAAAALSLVAVAIFATFPSPRPGVASLSTPSLVAGFLLRALVFALIVLAASLACLI